MFLNAINQNISLLIASMAALSVFFACLVVSWPYLLCDTLGTRVRQFGEERESIRIRERAKLQGSSPSLRTEPKKLFKDIVDRLG